MVMVLYRRVKWKVVRGKAKVRGEALNCTRKGWPHMRAEIAKLLGVCPNKLPPVSGATKTHCGFPAPLSKEEEEKEEREEKEEQEKDEYRPFRGMHHCGAPGHFPITQTVRRSPHKPCWLCYLIVAPNPLYKL
jgi:hypothetical protein